MGEDGRGGAADAETLDIGAVAVAGLSVLRPAAGDATWWRFRPRCRDVLPAALIFGGPGS